VRKAQIGGASSKGNESVSERGGGRRGKRGWELRHVVSISEDAVGSLTWGSDTPLIGVQQV
jgi:hypothetical protein